MIIETNGVRLHVHESGQGLPLLLIHGFPLAGPMWQPLVAELAGSCQTIVPDLRGFGQSPPTAEPITLDDYAADMAGLLDQLGLAQAVIGGLSMGGYIALAFARRFPQRMLGLVLMDTRAGADSAEGRAGRDALIAQVRERGPVAVADQMLPKLLSPVTYHEQPGLGMRVREMIEANPPAGIIAALVAMRERPDATADLAAIAVPTLVVVGAEDTITPPAEARRLVAAIPGAQLETIAHAAHLSPLEQPAFVGMALRGWLRSLAARPAD